MEDPWSNAWSESEQPPSTQLSNDTPWVLTSPAAVLDESDIAGYEEEEREDAHHDAQLPSWPTGQPSWRSDAATFWPDTSHVSPLDGWRSIGGSHSGIPESSHVSQTAEDIPGDEEEKEEDEEPEVVLSPKQAAFESPAASPSSPVAEESDSRLDEGLARIPAGLLEQPVPTPDPFGTFETGISPHSPEDDLEEAWPNSFQAAESIGEKEQTWDAVWKAPANAEDDEWAVAREEKRKRDRRVVSTSTFKHPRSCL